MSAKCVWCQSYLTNKIYIVPTSRLGACIFNCEKCNLTQSVYANLDNKHRYKSISSDADWGNVRHGKGVRLQKSIECLKDILPEIKSLIDIGSNRGNFCEWVSGAYPNISIDMVEPDRSIVDYNFKFNSLLNDRVENIDFSKKYDLLYCCHTLEHLDDIHGFFRKELTNKYIFIDVPNIEVINKTGNIEEFFIDKHTFHFSTDVIHKILLEYGFKVVNDVTDDYNITLVCKKITPLNIEHYVTDTERSRGELIKKCDRINSIMDEKKVVLYGATRIYDACIRYGKLNKEKIYYLVDDHLHGTSKSDRLLEDPPDLVIVMARSSTGIIAKKLESMGLVFEIF